MGKIVRYNFVHNFDGVLIGCLFAVCTVLYIGFVVDQLPPEDLIFDLQKGTLCRNGPDIPVGGKFKYAENHLWLDYYNELVELSAIQKVEWKGMQQFFLDNGFNRTIDSLLQLVIYLCCYCF